jgi:A1 cistron-splicing factor AAR2
MDPEKAKQLFVEGATLVLLDVPLKTEFGIDYNSWNVGKNFKGVKMIPPGFHFVFYR